MERPCYACSPVPYPKSGGTLVCVCSYRKKRKQWDNTDKLKYLYKCCHSIIGDNKNEYIQRKTLYCQT